MNAEVFSEWLRRQGHKIYRTPSSYWYNAGPRVLQAFPYHWIITPDVEEIHSLMIKHGILALRYSAPPDHREGKISYHIVLHNCYDLPTLKAKARNSVKRGLEHFTVEPVAFERLAGEGWILQKDTLLRQNRLQSMSQKQWEILCHSATDLPGFSAFAALSEGRLAGALIVCRIDDVFAVPYATSHSRYLSEHVNNALFFTVCCKLLKQEGINSIFFTLQSLDAPAQVDDFKLRMGFESKLVRQNVAVHPFLKPFINTSFYSLNRKLLKHYPANPLLNKSEGILRFHLEGRRPAMEQNCPECLKEEMKLLYEREGIP